jgi:hypothetical protein
MSVIQETPEYWKLKYRQLAEYDALVMRQHSKRELHRLATKHTNEFIRLVRKWAHKEARKNG